MILHYSISKPFFQPAWLQDTKVEAQHHQMEKEVPKERINIILSKVTYHHIFQKFKISRDVSNIAAKKKLT